MSGSEPSDAIRAVNALLTQLDALRRHPNALVLTTSNITQVTIKNLWRMFVRCVAGNSKEILLELFVLCAAAAVGDQVHQSKRLASQSKQPTAITPNR